MRPAIFRDVFGRRILLTKYAVWHILRRVEMGIEGKNIGETLSNPDSVVKSSTKRDVLIFNKEYPEKSMNDRYLVVVAKILNKHGLILTSYRSSRPKAGDFVWKK